MSKASSRYPVFIALLLLSCWSFAQEKLLTMDEAILKARTTLAPKNLKQPQWLPGGSVLTYTDNRSGREVMFAREMNNLPEKVLLELSKINKELLTLKTDTLVRFPEIHWLSTERFRFIHSSSFLEYDIKAGSIKKLNLQALDQSAESFDFNSSFSAFSFSVNSDLWMADETGKIVKIAGDGNPALVYGQSVHRNEFGINKGTFWSPDQQQLAFYRMDQSMVEKYPLNDYKKIPTQTNDIYYPMAGRTSHRVSIGVYHRSSASIIYLATGEPDDHYLTNVSWSPDSKEIYVAELNRAQNHMKMNVYEASSGKFLRTLFEEKDEKYTEPLHPSTFIPGSPDKFIWQSNRDGFNHLYLYNNQGKLLKQLTRGLWEVTRMVGFGPKASTLIFECTSQGGLGREIRSVNLSSGKITKLSEGSGTHRAIMMDGAEYYLDVHSSVSIPNKVTLKSLSKGNVYVLIDSDNPLKDYAITPPQISFLKSDAGDTLFTRTFLPRNFDAKKKYPVVVYLYGGPHAQMITDSWLGGANLWFHYMAQRGYVVFTLDNRGSDARGKKFEQATFRNLGEVEMADQMKGVQYLRQLSYVDTTRMGIHGWSFGGFMTTTMMTRQPNVFKVGIAGGPVIDWSMYEVMYTERYMDTPEENPEGYKNSNLLNYVNSLQGRLLLIHGTSDDVVLWQHSINYLKKCVDKGVQMDYFVYPGHAHNVLGKDRVHLMEKVSRYFFDFL
jgi:dipeptidyl-peptidase-4